MVGYFVCKVPHQKYCWDWRVPVVKGHAAINALYVHNDVRCCMVVAWVVPAENRVSFRKRTFIPVIPVGSRGFQFINQVHATEVLQVTTVKPPQGLTICQRRPQGGRWHKSFTRLYGNSSLL